MKHFRKLYRKNWHSHEGGWWLSEKENNEIIQKYSTKEIDIRIFWICINFTYFYYPQLLHNLKAVLFNEASILWLFYWRSFWISFKSFEKGMWDIEKEKKLMSISTACISLRNQERERVDERVKKSKEEKWNKNKLNLKDWSKILES